MKNEQEIVRSVFDDYIRNAKASSTKKDRPTFDMLEEVKNKAIKALEQQPCEDCVSREQAVKAITDWYIDMLENGEGKDPINVLDNLPPATPIHSWIPVSEKLPECEGLYLVSVKNDRLRQYSKTCWFNSHLNWFSRQDVIAWQPLPKPYEEKRGDENEVD